MKPKAANKNRWAVALLVFLAGYIGSHFALSRISRVKVDREWGTAEAFIYLPVDPDLVADHEMPLLYAHLALRGFYLPIWKLDHHVLGGPWPLESMPLRSMGV